jgi:hypothetical protein
MQILVTTLAEYQTRFWLPVGLELHRRGHRCSFVSFDDRSTEMLRDAGLEVFARSDQPVVDDLSDAALDGAAQRYGIQDLSFWFGHERFAFRLHDPLELRRKLLVALTLADRACVALERRGSTVLVQELGGFLSVVGAFFAARAHQIDNWFIEPSFFRGRLFFVCNSFAAPQVRFEGGIEVSAPVRDYLRSTLSSGAIVIPQKDRHQYTTAFKKVFNIRNAKRLIEKLVDKHILGKRQEFGYIGHHVRVHLNMVFSGVRLRRWYTPLEKVRRFVYYPLHVPGDMALTLRSPQYLDQLSLVDYLARAVPHTHKVAIKEHPAMIGLIDVDRVRDLLRRYDNLVLLPPSTNNFQVLKHAEAVVSVNSKSGAEACLLGKPTLVLGDAFYRQSPLVKAVSHLTELPAALRTALQGEWPGACEQVREQYFEQVWRQSLPGELYVAASENVDRFVTSLLEAVGRRVVETS